jgi:nucleotide-binding universal stress UspA family protein
VNGENLMLSVRSILMPATAGPASDAACAVTTRLALTFGSSVTPLHVIDAELKGEALDHYRSIIDLQLMSPLVTKMKNDSVDVASSVIATGGVVDQILRNADELNVDLIVMGAGERSHDGIFTPSPITESVIQQARRPVLAALPGQSAPVFQRILCPIDGSGISVQGLRNAIRLAQAFQAELTVLTVVPKVKWVTTAAEGEAVRNVQEHYAALWEKDFNAVLQTVDFGSITWNEIVRQGWPGPEILATAAEYQHDLIVIGATGRTGVTRVLLGTTARQVVHKLPCSLLVIHDRTKN